MTDLHDQHARDSVSQGQAMAAASDADWRLILASSSPRRHELIKYTQLNFEIVPSKFEEFLDQSWLPSQLVLHLAMEKARDVFQDVIARNLENQQHICVLGADTMVFLDNQLLGKPDDFNDAFRMLKKLSGRWHEVYTGVSLITKKSGSNSAETFSDIEVSRVLFRPLQEAEITAYIETGEPMDKAGAYALQGIGSAFVAKIEGCFTNIIGLPVPKVVSMLRSAGIEVLGCSNV